MAFSLLLLGLNIGFVGIRERLIAVNRTGKAFASFPSLVSLWQEENFTLGTHPVILTSSRICINYTSTRQGSFCHSTLNNKRQTTRVNEDLFTVPSAILEMQPRTRENEAGVDSR